METTEQINQAEVFVKTFIQAWVTNITRTNQLLEGLSEEELMQETTPGRNTGIYLLGHLVAVHDAMFPLLGFGDKQYPQLEKLFITTPDKSGQEFPPLQDLKKYWQEVNNNIVLKFNALSTSDWLTKHSSISAEDFIKEPHRNKLSILVSRIHHLSYHLGQLSYLKKKKI